MLLALTLILNGPTALAATDTGASDTADTADSGDTGDTAGSTDTADTADTGASSGSGAAELSGEAGGCGCSSTQAPGVAAMWTLLALGGLLTWRRRR